MVHASSVIPAGIGGRSSPALGCGSGNRITFGQGAHRVRLFRRCATRNAGRHPLTTGADGAHLKWIVCRASGGYSKLARVVRISYTLSRDTTRKTRGPGIFATVQTSCISIPCHGSSAMRTTAWLPCGACCSARQRERRNRVLLIAWMPAISRSGWRRRTATWGTPTEHDCHT
jgi:hypothetical protein